MTHDHQHPQQPLLPLQIILPEQRKLLPQPANQPRVVQPRGRGDLHVAGLVEGQVRPAQRQHAVHQQIVGVAQRQQDADKGVVPHGRHGEVAGRLADVVREQRDGLRCQRARALGAAGEVHGRDAGRRRRRMQRWRAEPDGRRRVRAHCSRGVRRASDCQTCSGRCRLDATNRRALLLLEHGVVLEHGGRPLTGQHVAPTACAPRLDLVAFLLARATGQTTGSRPRVA